MREFQYGFLKWMNLNIVDSKGNRAAMIARFGEIVKALPEYFAGINICFADWVLPMTNRNHP